MRNHTPRNSTKPGNGFTLIELLMVFAVIAILAAITFGISRGVADARNRAKAKVELAAISQALEQYKARYGDYPWINIADVENNQQVRNASHGLLKTLVGWQAYDGTQVGGTDSDGNVFEKAKSVLDVSKLTLSDEWPTSSPEASPGLDIYFEDPWGNAYVYIYKRNESPGTWEKFGYILFSRGPDGLADSDNLDESDGTFEDEVDFKEASGNIDNIYAGQ
ncbi:MAG TPA: prepilin-type N-terminal cleavage/methylation domain-containing protein [Opitutales bacterium]|nr:prepilin-type N-terminal cleavage/methylation domain-containing protein [Opitutales bacterium]